MICRKSMDQCQTPGMCSPYGGCPAPVPAVARQANEFSFTPDGIGFKGMPLERVAKYMTAVAELAGETAVFVRMDEHSIVFVDGAGQLTPKTSAHEVEAAAREVYEQWAGQPGYLPWVDYGNSIMQDKARSAAAQAVKVAK